MIVDDNAAVREGLESILSANADITVVTTANNGEQAVDGVAAHAPDVMLMDSQMPGMDGVEATRRIKALSPGAKVLFLTVYPSHIPAGLAAGAEPMIVGVYRDGIDVRHVTLRNFEPGQVTERHIHPENAHCIYILEGSGEVLRDGAPPLPIKAGQFLIVPGNTQHGLRNTGNRRLSYLGVNAGAEPGR